MELIMMIAAFLLFCFGTVVSTKIFGIGFQLSFLACNSVKALIRILGQFIYKKAKCWSRACNASRYTVAPIVLTPVELQHLKNQGLLKAGRRFPMQIEYDN